MVYTYKYINIQVGPLDWPEWASDASEHVSYKGYVKDIVKGSCENFMRAKVASHVSPLKYLSLPSSDMAVCQNLVPLVNIKMVLIGIDPYPYPEKVATQVHVGHAGGASRLLAPVVWLYPAGHVDFRPSKASIRWCIFCGKRYGNIYICTCFQQLRCSRCWKSSGSLSGPKIILLQRAWGIFPSCCSICSRYRPKGSGILTPAWNVSIKKSDGRKWL